MATTIHVTAARIPDRDRLLEAIREAGLDAEPHDELEIAVPVADGGDGLLHHVEGVILSVGAPFVPTQHERVIYIRPPVG